MNTQSLIVGSKSIAAKSFILGVTALAASICAASATITFDLRASAIDSALGTLGNSGKQVTVRPNNVGNVTLQVWAQVANAAPTSNVFGVQVILGSIVSNGATGITGALTPLVPSSPFDNQSYAGTAQELSIPADTLGDLGAPTTSTAPVTNVHIRPRKDPTSAGTQVGTVFFASNLAPAGATVNPITNGFEFLMGTLTLSITNFSSSGTGLLNWFIPTFTVPANRGQIAQWTDGDGAVNNGNTQFAEMSVGSPISLVAVPEPSAFGMVLLGAMGIAGFRRISARRI